MHRDISGITPIELGRRLSEARRARNLTQENIAQKLGMSRPTLIAIEKGTRMVKPDEMIQFAKLYGKSVHDLLNKYTVIADFPVQFRMSQTIEISEESILQAVALFTEVCENYVMLENMLDAPMPRYQYPEVYALDRLTESVSVLAIAEEIAMTERSRLNLGHGPLGNLLDTLEGEVGLRVFIFPLSEFKIAGMFGYTETLGGCILINGDHPLTRQRWSLAHEYAHFLVDRYHQEVSVLVESSRKPKREIFADAFAASFLMPAIGVRQRFHKTIQSKGDFKVADLCFLADQYGVSVEALTRRLEALNCVKTGMWDHLSQNVTLSKVNKHLKITTPASDKKRLPERFTKLAVQAFEEELISESKLMRFLRVDRVEAREIIDALTEREDMGDSGNLYQLDLDFSEVVLVK